MRLRSTMLIVGLFCFALTLSAQASSNPKLISYQGRLLTSGGAPVPDGTYAATFTLFNSQTLGQRFWYETAGIVTNSGDFTHLLGSVTPIPDSIFPMYLEVWLQVTIGTETLTPRVRVTSAGYALQVNTIDQARGGVVSDSIVLRNDLLMKARPGEPQTISQTSLYASGRGSGADFYEPLDSKARIALNVDGSAVAGGLRAHIGDDGIALYEPAGGPIHTAIGPDPDGLGGGLFQMGNPMIEIMGFEIDGNYAGTGDPRIRMMGNGVIELNSSMTGDGAVRLPTNAINATECLDEPGIANEFNISTFSLTTTMQDVATITVTIPTSGYIFLTGKLSEATLYGTTGSNFFYLQIDETAGGGVLVPYYSACGSSAFPNASAWYYSPTAQRTYFKPAGTYTFRLEACRGGSGPGAGSGASWATLTAMFYPTAYGTVSAVASDGNNPDLFEHVSMVPAGITSGTAVTTSDMRVVDLRELELKAANARADAEKAERELAEARLQQQTSMK